MKSGTTSLYRDLKAHPSIFLPEAKEPGNLRSDGVLTPLGIRQYSGLFRGAGDDQIVGEATTGYTKSPQIADVPRRALSLLGPDLKLIYLLRNPIGRVISHHNHAYAEGKAALDIGEAVLSDPIYIQTSKYAMQASLWLDCFDRKQLLVVRAEDYVRQRERMLSEIFAFLGVGRVGFDWESPGRVHNRGDGKLVPGRLLRTFHRQLWLRRLVHENVPTTARERARRLLAGNAPPRPQPPTPRVIEFLFQELAPDVREQVTVFGLANQLWSDHELCHPSHRIE